jgi:hypothetical protein
MRQKKTRLASRDKLRLEVVLDRQYPLGLRGILHDRDRRLIRDLYWISIDWAVVKNLVLIVVKGSK